MTADPGQWHRLHPLSPLVRSGRAAIGVLAIVGISASGQFGRDGSHLYDWALAVLVVIAAVVSWLRRAPRCRSRAHTASARSGS